jgi:hypothetical protein
MTSEKKNFFRKSQKNSPKRLKMSEIEFHVLMSNEQKSDFTLESNCHFSHLQIEIEHRLRVDIQNQRLISSGIEINSDHDFQSLKTRSPTKITFHLNDRAATTQPITDDTGSSITTSQVPEPEISKKYKFAWVLLANIFECLKSLDQGGSSSQRIRISNVPEDIVFTDMNVPNTKPKVDDLAHLVKKLSHAFELLSVHMKANSEMLKTLVDVQEKKDLAKNRSQLVFDACRYLSALNQILACIIIPLRHEAPRFLSWRPNPVANQQRN